MPCKAPDILPGTPCLPNTNGRCTWCGKPMKDSRPLSGQLRRFRRAEDSHESTREFGTDPVAWLDGDEEEA